MDTEIVVKLKVLVTQTCLTLFEPMEPASLPCPWNSPGKNTEVGCHSLFQGIFPKTVVHIYNGILLGYKKKCI